MARDMKATRIVFDPPNNEYHLAEVGIERWPEKGITEIRLTSTSGQHVWYAAFPLKGEKREGATVFTVRLSNPSDASD